MKREVNPYIAELKALPAAILPADRNDAAAMAEYQQRRAAIKAAAEKVVEKGDEMRKAWTAAGRVYGEKELKSFYGITISHMTGKLEDLRGVSTSAPENEICRIRSLDVRSICHECYVSGLFAMKKNVAASTGYNGRILQNVLLERDAWPAVLYSESGLFRVESFGDAAGVVHAENYVILMHTTRIIDASGCRGRFGVWTKNPGFYDVAIRRHGRPDYVSFILSDPVMNGSDEKWLHTMLQRFTWIDGVFAVMTLDHAARTGAAITCGGRRCKECRVCYDAFRALHGVRMVIEMVKDDQKIGKTYLTEYKRRAAAVEKARERFERANVDGSGAKAWTRAAAAYGNARERLQAFRVAVDTASGADMDAARILDGRTIKYLQDLKKAGILV